MIYTHTPFVVAGREGDSHLHDAAAVQDAQLLYSVEHEVWLGHTLCDVYSALLLELHEEKEDDWHAPVAS